MGSLKKIALVTSASNFERHKNVIKAVHNKLKQLGNYALYVISSYGLYRRYDIYENGEASIYALLEKGNFDGCILEGNIDNGKMLRHMADICLAREIPFVTLNIGVEEHPFFMMDSYYACCDLMAHLIEKHHCEKINMVAVSYEDNFRTRALQAYKDTLEKYHIPVEEKRIIYNDVSIKNGREVLNYARENGIDDAQATLCMHDVFAIGLCMEMQEQGIRVPEEMKICSLNYSTNSSVFRPNITGADRGDRELAEMACESLDAMIEGKCVPRENYVKGHIHYGESCGCNREKENIVKSEYQELILNKIEMGNQISRMMQYNDSLESVSSLDELGDSIQRMLWGISCKEFVLNLNLQTVKYIANDDAVTNIVGAEKEGNMLALVGFTERTGRIADKMFDKRELCPVPAMSGDIFLFLPVHHMDREYGYITIINEYLPIDTYNYRICHESLGIGMENLHRQMILRKSIQELDELHMRDALTGLYNRFAWRRFSADYINEGNYSVAMLDMDRLKKINDTFGHLAGNHAISLVANAIKTSISSEDLLIRYGGDEFQILSNNTDTVYWSKLNEVINRKLQEYVMRQKLPYSLGVSLGFCIHCTDSANSFEECCEIADQEMYGVKNIRHKLLEGKM